MGDMLLGLDADTILTPFASRIVQAGFAAVGRYLKNLSLTEVAALHAAGVGIWLIFEAGAENVLGGTHQGAIDGQRALAQAQALSAPSTAAIYATADTDVTEDQLPAAINYWAAFDAVLTGEYQIGGYADGTVLSGLRSSGLPYVWLAGAMGWDGSRDFLANGNPTMVQGPTIIANTVGTFEGQAFPAMAFDYDPNLIMAPDAGLWLP